MGGGGWEGGGGHRGKFLSVTLSKASFDRIALPNVIFPDVGGMLKYLPYEATEMTEKVTRPSCRSEV